MYGAPVIKKTESQKKGDEEFVKSVIKNSGSRDEAAQKFAAWGWMEKDKKNNRQAIMRFNQSWLINEDYYQPYWGFGAVMLSERKPDKAIKYFERALELIDDGDNQKPRLLVDSARPYVIKAVQIKVKDPENSQRLYKIANIRIDKALELDPNYKSAYQFGGAAAYLQGDYKRAWNIVKKSRKTGAYKFDPKFIRMLTSKMHEPNT